MVNIGCCQTWQTYTSFHHLIQRTLLLYYIINTRTQHQRKDRRRRHRLLSVFFSLLSARLAKATRIWTASLKWQYSFHFLHAQRSGYVGVVKRKRKNATENHLPRHANNFWKRRFWLLHHVLFAEMDIASCNYFEIGNEVRWAQMFLYGMGT